MSGLADFIKTTKDMVAAAGAIGPAIGSVKTFIEQGLGVYKWVDDSRYTPVDRDRLTHRWFVNRKIIEWWFNPGIQKQIKDDALKEAAEAAEKAATAEKASAAATAAAATSAEAEKAKAEAAEATAKANAATALLTTLTLANQANTAQAAADASGPPHVFAATTATTSAAAAAAPPGGAAAAVEAAATAAAAAATAAAAGSGNAAAAAGKKIVCGCVYEPKSPTRGGRRSRKQRRHKYGKGSRKA